MGYLPPFPAQLERVEYIKLFFLLEFKDSFDLPPAGVLQLRRELSRALVKMQEQADAAALARLSALLQPPLPADPLLRKQVQKPSPALVFTPDCTVAGPIVEGRRMVLPVLLLGSGIHALQPFIELIRELGTLGFYCNRGRFKLVRLEAEQAAGSTVPLSFDGTAPLAPPICDLGWWLERQPQTGASLRIDLTSPLRLLRQGKPLFKASFREIFPFILRRVTGMLASHAGADNFCSPTMLISAVGQVKELENSLRWQDWRSLQKDLGEQKLGGLMGHLLLEGEALSELLWVLQVGSLLNVGKGASFGNGQYVLCVS